MFPAERLQVPARQRPPLPPLLARLQLLALEPRVLFDGAVVATADAAAPTPSEGPTAGRDGAEGAGAPVADPAEPAGFEPVLLSAASDIGEPLVISVHKGAFADASALLEAVRSGAEAVGAADLAQVDAADTVHYAISVSNRGSGYAFDLQVQDRLPDQIAISSVSNLRLLDTDGAEVDYSGGGVLRNGATGEPISSGSDFAAALFSDCAVEFVDPGCGEGFLGGSCTHGRPGEATIAYEVSLPGAVVAGSDLCNQARVVQAAARDCGDNLVDPCAPPADGAKVSIDGAHLTTRLTATSQAHTPGTDAVIGEILCYETVITVPEGCSPQAVLTQQLAPGLSLVSVDSIVYSEGVEAQSSPAPEGVLPEDAGGGQANRFVIDFGDISNRNRDNQVRDTITVTFRAVAGNVWGNQQGQELAVEAGYRSGDGSRSGGHGDATLVELTAAAVPVVVVEPVLNVTVTPDGAVVEAGGPAEFIIIISNDSRTDAFDVTIDDIVLPAGLQLHPDSWAPGQESGLVAPVLAAGERMSLRLLTVVARDAPAGQELGVDVQVRYTSLPQAAPDCGSCASTGASQDLSPFVRDSDRERTGRDGPGGLDDYVAGDTGSVLPVSGQPPHSLPPPCEPPSAPPPSAPPPSAPPPSAPPPSAPPPAAPPPAAPPPSAPPPAAPPPAAPPPAAPPPSAPPPSAPPPSAPPPSAPPPSAPPASVSPPAGSRPGLLPEDRWSPSPRTPLAELFSYPLPPLLLEDPFARNPPPALQADDVELPSEPAPAPSAEKAVALEDDCIPVKPPEPKPKPAKPRVFGDAVRPKRFSEQIGAAKMRLSPAPRPQPEC